MSDVIISQSASCQMSGYLFTSVVMYAAYASHRSFLPRSYFTPFKSMGEGRSEIGDPKIFTPVPSDFIRFVYRLTGHVINGEGRHPVPGPTQSTVENVSPSLLS